MTNPYTSTGSKKPIPAPCASTVSDREKEADVKSFFDQKPVYGHWVKLGFWEAEEAVMLLHNIQPDEAQNRKYDINYFSNYVASSVDRSQEPYKTANRIVQCYEMMRRDPSIKQEKFSLTPILWIEWGKRNGFSAPKLAKAVKAMKKNLQHKSQKPPLYTTPYLELMRDAIIENEITADNQGNVESLKQWFIDKGMSKRLASAMPTIIRLPESKAGAAKPRKNG